MLHLLVDSAKKNKQAYFFLRSPFTIFELKLQDTSSRCEKYSSKLDISRSLIRIFANGKL